MSREMENDVLHFVKHQIARGESSSLLELGFSMRHLQLIKETDSIYLAQLPASRRKPFITSITICSESLEELGREVSIIRRRDNIIEKLLRANANANLMAHFFGMNRREISERRKLVGVSCAAGRPEKETITPYEKGLILQLTKDMVDNMALSMRGDPVIQCDVLLRVSDMTSKPLNTVWKVVRTQQEKNKFNW